MKMRLNKKAIAVSTLMCLFPCLITAVMWSRLPQEMPIHWDVNGEVDRYASKLFACFGLPCFLAALNLLCHFATGFDKRRENHSKALIAMTYWLIPVLSIIVSSIMLLSAMGKEIKVEIVLPLLVGPLFIFIGNYLPKCKQNSTMGIRLPWTLKNEENWNKTHRLGGWLWIVSGFVTIISTLLGFPIIFIAVVLINVLVPTVYSFVLHKKGI